MYVANKPVFNSFILRHDNKYSTKIIFACICVHERNRIIKASNYQNLHTETQQADDKIITSSDWQDYLLAK